MFISIRQAKPRPSPVLPSQEECSPTSAMSPRERVMKRSSKGWSKKTQAMEGFAFTIKTQTAGKEDSPIICEWRSVVGSPDEPSKKYGEFCRLEPSSYFLEASPAVHDAHKQSGLILSQSKWLTNQELRGVFDHLKGWITRKGKIEVPAPRQTGLQDPEVVLPVSKHVDTVTAAVTTVPDPSPVAPWPQRKRPKHPVREVDSGERLETSWMELWKAAKAGIARHNAILPTRQVARGTSLRKQIIIHGSPLRQSHVVKKVAGSEDEHKGSVEPDNAKAAAAVQEAMFKIIHKFDLPHKHKRNRHRNRSLASQVTRHEFRQNMVGQYSKSAGAPARMRPRPYAIWQIPSMTTTPIPE